MKVTEEPRAVRGFRFAGVSAGLKTKADALDLGLIVAERPAAAAGVFTTNRVKAAPVVIASERLRSGRLQAVAANSGSANCFTGAAGMKLAQESCAAVAEMVGCAEAAVAPCSTGVIGHLYDLEKFRIGAKAAAAGLAADGLGDFARAIMTTDTRPKVASAVIRAGGAELTIAGAAKGAGMIAPRMATLLAFIVTDAAVAPGALRTMLKGAAAGSFNAITIDGDMSTNDTLIAMASGAAGNRPLSTREAGAFAAAMSAVAESLARQLVHDGEGASKLVTIAVRGARSDADAERMARQIANSPLVKTAFFGCDPNVGRLLMAAGASGAAIEPERLRLKVAGVTVAERGRLAVEVLEEAGRRMAEREFSVELDLRLGRGKAAILTSDFSYEYVRINAEYTT
ncbi:MAG TPA: bifunctional glutamate N-acetyltransferase/amino-acid acetyltransferase ArgJ [Candidatus Binataceae bacterium]|nr:bifunctional glutamate N-acetyltransferase/amino-acid acetyltransferase ArgJ [Candidatus Binataceae bacterium]